MSNAGRAKKSGKNTKKPQLYDLTQGMPKPEGAGGASEVEVFQPVREEPQAAPEIPTPAPVRTEAPVAPGIPVPNPAMIPRPVPVIPPAPVIPQVPEAPQVPVTPQAPVTPQIPVTPQLQPRPLAFTRDDTAAPAPVMPQVPVTPQLQPRPLDFTRDDTAAPAPVMPEVPVTETSDTEAPPRARSKKKKAHTVQSHGKKKRRPQNKKSDLSQVYDYVNGKKTLDLPEGVQGATEALPQGKPKKTYVPVKEGKGKTRPATLKAERERRRKQEERLTYMIVICVILFLVASGFLLKILWNYRRTAAEYAGLADAYVVQLEPEDATEGDTAEEEAFPALNIDFPGLFALNTDLVSWIYVPGCDISYPIVQTSDNDYYLNHTFLKNLSSCGAIFMDTGDHNDYSDFNTFLYGHNMQDGSMFGTLHRLWQDEELADKKPYFYIYLKNGGVRKYRIISYYRDHGDSDSYLRMQTDAEEQNYAEMIMEKSAVNPEKSPVTASQTLSSDDSLVTLSTCHGGVNSGQRFLVHGKLIGVY